MLYFIAEFVEATAAECACRLTRVYTLWPTFGRAARPFFPFDVTTHMSAEETPDAAADQPWLEHYGAKGSIPEKTPLDEFPFTIGRNESAHLQIDSGRVSREHATISFDGEQYRIRDLASTNGTYVNGRRIGEALLSDGDILLIANVEFGFFCRSSRVTQTTVTQVMGPEQFGMDSSVVAREDVSRDITRAVRRLQEITVQCSIRTLFDPIISLEVGRPLGYEAREDDGESQPCADRMVRATDCRLVGRFRRLRRLIAAEEAAGLPEGLFLFVGLDASELGADRLLESLIRLRDVVAVKRQLVIELPEGAASDVPHCLDFRRCLRELGIGISYSGFSAATIQLLQQTEVPPNFVKLNESLVRGLQDNVEHQQQIRSVVGAGGDLGCEIIAAGVSAEDDARICRELGCRLGQGDLFGTPHPVDSLRVPAGPATPSRYVTPV